MNRHALLFSSTCCLTVSCRYGKDAGDASLLAGKTIHNVGLVYLDVRGVGRRALIKKAGKSFLRAKLGNRDVIFGVDEHGQVADS